MYINQHLTEGIPQSYPLVLGLLSSLQLPSQLYSLPPPSSPTNTLCDQYQVSVRFCDRKSSQSRWHLNINLHLLCNHHHLEILFPLHSIMTTERSISINTPSLLIAAHGHESIFHIIRARSSICRPLSMKDGEVFLLGFEDKQGG